MEEKANNNDSKDSSVKTNTQKTSTRKVLPICFLCNKVPEEGVRGGFIIKGVFICSRCEEELINIKPENVENAEKYKEAIKKLRKIFLKEKPW